MDLNAIYGKLNKIRQEKDFIKSEYQRKMTALEKEEAAELEAIRRIEEALAPIKCQACNGSGERRFTDAAGSRDTEPCKECKGTGVDIK